MRLEKDSTMKKTLISAALAFALGAGFASAAVLEEVASDGGAVMAASKTGMTVYTFQKDAAGVSNCYDDCAAKWPPFMAGEAAKAEGDLGIIDRTDGTRQWTLKGMPLYFWAGDQAKGDATGDGVGGVWDVVRP
jgi:predicted lipoprotein with Yx(FWY)xxD motif